MVLGPFPPLSIKIRFQSGVGSPLTKFSGSAHNILVVLSILRMQSMQMDSSLLCLQRWLAFVFRPFFLYVNAWTLLAFFRRSQDNIKSAYFRVSLGTPFVSSQFIWRDLTGCFIIEPFSLWWFSHTY